MRIKVLLTTPLLLVVVGSLAGILATGPATTAVADEEADAKPSLVSVGAQAPSLRLLDTAGTRHTLRALKGKKVVLLSFPTVTCPVCTGSAPAHARIFDKFKDSEGFAFWGVYPRVDAETLKAYGKEHDLKYPLLLDSNGRGKAAYGVTITPTLVLVGKDGKVLAVSVGWTDDTEKRLVSQIEAALGGKPVPDASPEAQPGRG